MDIRARLKKLFACRAVLWEMSLRQLKVKYSGSMLGLWWALLIPLILAFSINFVFTQVFKAGVDNYAFFILSGMLPWAFFSGTLAESSEVFFSHSPILKQGTFPREFTVFSVVIANFLNFCIGVLLLLPVFILLNTKVLSLLPVLLLVIFIYLVFVAGMSLFCSVANIFFRDTAHFLSIALMAWFWVTPVFYPVQMVEPVYQRMLFLNPLTHFMFVYQDILFRARLTNVASIINCLVISFVFFAFAYFYFLKLESKIMKKI